MADTFNSFLEAEKFGMKKNLIMIATLAVTILATDANSGEIVRSASATKEELTQYWSQHDSYGFRAVNTTATTLYILSGRSYAAFTVDAADKITGLPVQLAMISMSTPR